MILSFDYRETTQFSTFGKLNFTWTFSRYLLGAGVSAPDALPGFTTALEISGEQNETRN